MNNQTMKDKTKQSAKYSKCLGGVKPLMLMLAAAMILVSSAWAQPVLDMTESLQKVSEPAIFHDLGDKGFAVYDGGEQKLKFFDWNFQYLNGITITRGEGPAQIMHTVLSACLLNDSIYIIGLMEKKIKVFDRKGKLIKSIPIDIIPKKMVPREDKFLLFNLRLKTKENSFVLGKVIEPNTGKPVKEIILHNKLGTEKLFDGNAALIGLSSVFDAAADNTMYILISASNTLYEINAMGNVTGKIELPYKEKKTIRQVERNGETKNVLSIIDWYTDMRAINGKIYACFLKQYKKDEKTGRGIFKTHVLKIDSFDNKKHPEKVIDGNCVIIGKNNGRLFLFNTDDYQVTSIGEKEW